MAEQTGQHGYLFRFDKVNATAEHMLLQLHPGMDYKKNQVNASSIGSQKNLRFRASCSQHIPRNPKGHEKNPDGF
jgi:hypothetical protein